MRPTPRSLTPLLIAGALAISATACGDDATNPSPGGNCPEVELGKRDDGTTAYASVDEPKNVDCATAQRVVKDWGAQNAGLGPANLPAGWSCDAGSVCRNGDASVTFTLRFE
jgi:hypothetical protein